MNIMRFRRIVALLATATMVGSAQAAWAQTQASPSASPTDTVPTASTPSLGISSSVAAPSTDDQAATPTMNTSAIGDIIVTAQKRSESLQRVPIAITAITSTQLAANQTVTTRDIQFSTPTLVYNQSANNAQPFLRGIGSDLFGPNLDASVATYVDGVYISSGQGIVSSLLGVDRVEVLSGPQGTLFGRNAVGGAISVYTLTPDQTLKGRASVSYGNYDHVVASGYVSGPITKTLAVGLYGSFDRRDTFHSSPDAAPLYNHELKEGIRLKAAWSPVDAVKLIGSAEYTRLETTEAGALRNIQPDATGYLVGGTPALGKNIYSSDLPQGTRLTSQAYTLREEVGLGFADLVGITSYRKLGSITINDLDGTNAPLLADYAELYNRTFSQEVQLLSPTGAAITWIAGAYYFHEKSGYSPVSIFSPIAFQPAPFTAIQTSPQIVTNSYAAFGQATAEIVDNLRLTLGARYTRDEKSYAATDRFTTGTGIDGNETVVLPAIVYPELNAAWNKFTPKITLDYTMGRTLLYATYSKGFKGGAYNAAAPTAPGPVDPETMDAYETGFKSTFANGRVRLNAAAYYYKFQNLQVQLIGSDGATRLQNAAAGKAYGIEGALTVVPVHGLTLDASASWEGTKYSSFPNYASYVIGVGGNAAASFEVTGNNLIRAPKFASNLAANYTYDLAGGGRIDANAKWYYNGGYYWEATNRFRQDAYSLVNASIGYTLPGDKLSVTAFVSNLFDKNYQTSLLLLSVSTLVSDGEPRMYGVTLGWRL